MTILTRLFCLAVGYVFGLFQTSYFIGKAAHHTDIREHGSGNAGTTNAMRTFGKRAGALTLLGDCIKCILAVTAVKYLFGSNYPDFIPLLSIYAAAGCILGHNFPVYLNFRGGKGIAASVGFLLAFDLRMYVLCAVVFFTLFFLKHYVSLCSLCSYAAALAVLIVWGERGRYGMDGPHRLEMYLVMVCLTCLAYWRHRANIKRLLNGTESKIYLRKSGKE